MVITKTPFRVSFFGGGTDYPAWADEHGGAVLSTTIDKYCYLTCRYLPPFFDFNYKIRYNEQEHTKTIGEIRHPSARECLNFAGVNERIELSHNSDLPAMSGLGSSSAFTVGLLHALYALQDKPYAAKMQLASDAIHVEQQLIKENVGSQDQVAVALGGLNKIEFRPAVSPDGAERAERIRVSPLVLPPSVMREFENHLMLFFTGFSRNASEIAAEQIKNTKAKESELHTMASMVPEAVRMLSSKEPRFRDFGKLLHESWKLKRGLSSRITNSHIDNMYAAARSEGALGGKILGAGGGGFMLIFAEPGTQARIKEKLGRFLNVPFRFENTGSQVIFKIDSEKTPASY